MSERGKLFRGSVIITLGRVLGYGLSFGRNLILARILARADYGLAAVFAMAMTLLEISGRMAFGQQIVQSKLGDTPEFQASAHALQFVGGLCSSLLIAALSVPMARLFGVGQAWWAFAILAVVPLCQSVSHLDVSRRQRVFDYMPMVMVDIVPQVLITFAAWPLAVWLKDYRVIVWLMVAKALLGAAMTFAYADRPYRWSWQPEHVGSLFRFGWPLLLTGLVMFGAQQVDQVLVGAVFSLEDLAGYALAFSIVSMPWFILGQAAGSLVLPVFARSQDQPERFRRQYRLCVEAAALAGVLCTLPLILVGEQLVTALYGVRYRGTGVFMTVLGVASALRFLRFASTIASTAQADTLNQLYSNLWRGGSLPLALVVWGLGGKAVGIAACTIVAEILSAAYSMVRLWSRQGVPLRDNYPACTYVAALAFAEAGFALFRGADWGRWEAVGFTSLAFLIALGLAWIAFPDLMRLITELVRRRSGTVNVQSVLK